MAVQSQFTSRRARNIGENSRRACDKKAKRSISLAMDKERNRFTGKPGVWLEKQERLIVVAADS